MSRAPSIVRQTAITKAIKGAAAAGMNVQRVEVDPKTGRIVVIGGAQESTQLQNEWDDVK